MWHPGPRERPPPRPWPDPMKSLPKMPLTAAAVAACVLAGCGSSAKPPPSTSVPRTSTAPARGPGAGKPPVTLGTKNFTEELILGELYAQALRAKGFTIALRRDIGSSEVVDRSLRAGQLDGYPEYTGTILSALAHQTRRTASAEDTYHQARAFERGRGMELLAMTEAEDTDVIAATPSYAARNHLRSLGDLRGLGPGATLGAAPEFTTRFNGLIGLERVYGVTNLRFRPLRIGTQYQALASGRVQVAAVFTTDGELSQGGYALLADPQRIFGFQNVTFVVRRSMLEREGSAFARTIDAVSAKLSTQALRVMNAAVDLDQQSPAAVARQFLAGNGLI